MYELLYVAYKRCTCFAQALRVQLYFSPLLPMECPKCGQERYRCGWTQTQWDAYSARTLSYNCCKVCATDCYKVAPGELKHCWDKIKIHMEALHNSETDWITLFTEYMELPLVTRREPSRKPNLASRCHDIKPILAQGGPEMCPNNG